MHISTAPASSSPSRAATRALGAFHLRLSWLTVIVVVLHRGWRPIIVAAVETRLGLRRHQFMVQL